MTNGADCDVDCEATKQCAGVSELATVFGQKQKPWAVKTQIKIIRKKSRGISKRQQQQPSATLLHFWRALQFKIAVSQSVMKWNTPATSYKKSTKKLQKKETTKNNTIQQHIAFNLFIRIYRLSETLWNFDRNRNFSCFALWPKCKINVLDAQKMIATTKLTLGKYRKTKSAQRR